MANATQEHEYLSMEGRIGFNVDAEGVLGRQFSPLRQDTCPLDR